MYTPKHLKKWIEYVNYTGNNFDDFYVANWRFFRCTPTERSNFKYIKDHLRDCGVPEGMVIFPSFTDELMMCRYYILVHKDCERALRMADMFAERVERKGSLDPEAEVQLDRAAVTKCWHFKSIDARIGLCREAGISIFAARREAPTHELLVELLSEAA